MQIQGNYGLNLIGMIVASSIRSGNRKDDGKPYVLRENTITTGKLTFKHMESLDATNKSTHNELELFKTVSVSVDRANTESGVTTVWGEMEYQSEPKKEPKS